MYTEKPSNGKKLTVLLSGRIYRTEKMTAKYSWQCIKYMNEYCNVPEHPEGYLTCDRGVSCNDVYYHTSQPFFHEGLGRWVSDGHQFYVGVARIKETKVRKSLRQVSELPVKGFGA